MIVIFYVNFRLIVLAREEMDRSRSSEQGISKRQDAEQDCSKRQDAEQEHNNMAARMASLEEQLSAKMARLEEKLEAISQHLLLRR
jgi:hypothetical protein